MAWDPELYERFRRERAAPFEDALALVTRRERLTVVDLGCGTGELTRRLADALPGSDVLGIDASTEMLERSAPFIRPGLRFSAQRIEDVEGGFDLVFSHAAIQWLDDHEALVPHLLSLVRPGGQLVVQLPANHDHPAQRLLVEVAGEAPFEGLLGGYRRVVPVLAVERYAELLFAAGGIALTAMTKVYPHVLPDADAICDFTRATALLPYLERLPTALGEAFVARYRERLRARFPEQPVFFGFKRILFAATKPQQVA